MPSLPVIVFSAWSGTGKTTIIEQLIIVLKQKGLRVAALKHDAHAFEIDQEGKDSWRFSQAGADITIIQSHEKTALIEQRSLNLSDALAMIHDVDIVLAEGYNDIMTGSSDDCDHVLPGSADSIHIYRVGISRAATSKGLRTPAEDCIAIMTDDSSLSLPASPRVFALDDITGLAEFLLSLLSLSV